jgi:rhodanese-related sulfurtransferase
MCGFSRLRQVAPLASLRDTFHDASMPRFRKLPVDLAIDVRSKLEFWLGHLPDAVCLPVQTIGTTITKRTDITKDSRLLVYCASGARSAVAVSVLRGLGYKRVTDGGAISSARAEYTRD